ncbi:MAG: hypothetical protein AAFU54_18480 [Chloroflexota bacterium]
MQRKNVPHPQIRMMESLVEQKILDVSALAWAGYQQEGRGFIMVAFDPDQLDAQYHGERGDTWETLNPKESVPTLYERVMEYDPKTEFVALLAREKGATIYVFDEMPLPPPLAYEKVMAEG